MAYTYAQQLESVQTAIRTLETKLAQQVSEGDQTIIYQQLDPLYKREERLLKLVDGETESSKPISQRVCEFDNGLS